MRIFVLSTGRCGSTTFYKSCQHITNFTSGHETRANLFGSDRFAYPENHIEIDNRLSWHLGTLGQSFSNDLYIHLKRDKEAVIQSFMNRYGNGIIKAFHLGIRMGSEEEQYQVCSDYVDTVNDNISHFIRDKNHMTFNVETYKKDLPLFWYLSGAKGDFKEAERDFEYNHNYSSPFSILS